MTTTNRAAGTDGLQNMIGNMTSTIQMLGGAVIVLVLAVVAVMAMFGAFSQGSSLRTHIGRVGMVIFGAILLGGAAIVGPMFIDTGKDLTNGTNTSTNTGVN